MSCLINVENKSLLSSTVFLFWLIVVLKWLNGGTATWSTNVERSLHRKPKRIFIATAQRGLTADRQTCIIMPRLVLGTWIQLSEPACRCWCLLMAPVSYADRWLVLVVLVCHFLFNKIMRNKFPENKKYKKNLILCVSKKSVTGNVWSCKLRLAFIGAGVPASHTDQ